MFTGYTDQTVDVFWGIRFNNEKSWFEQHKETYRAHFYEPMKALAAQVYEIFQDRHGDLELATRVSRIYRDARRLFGRGPYKDHLWLTLFRWDGGEARLAFRSRKAWPCMSAQAFPSQLFVKTGLRFSIIAAMPSF